MGFFKKPAALLSRRRRRKAVDKVLKERKVETARNQAPVADRQGVNQSHGAHTGRMKDNRKIRNRKHRKAVRLQRQRLRRST